MSKEKCVDWVLLGETTGNHYYYCDKCGAIKDRTDVFLYGPVMAVNPDELYCPEQGYKV